MRRYKSALLFLILLIFSTVESFSRYSDFADNYYLPIAIFLIALNLIGWRLRPEIGFTFLFFALLHALRPLNIWFTGLVGADFNGTYFLIPTVLFLVLALLSPVIRTSLDWWKKESFTTPLLIKMLVATLIGSAALYNYLKNSPNESEEYLKMLPDGSFLFIVIMGMAFASLNAFIEELIFRGMVWNGLAKILNSTGLILLIQAMIFGFSHFWGLPGGWTGVLMTFTMSLAFGYFRLASGGIIAVTIVHFLLNLIQYFILIGMRG